jgi:DNA mismatch repair protein MutL
MGGRLNILGRIKLLDEHTANKIAAGEVIERPASIVKELVENSIDAGSNRIEISIIDGGLTGLIVFDNGVGMDSQDAKLAFERHATSKISDDTDLERITSLGFRGEALPSIAAVSKVKLTTRSGESLAGTELLVEGGNFLDFREIGCPVGTTIQVNDLFYNTPARKKHMKSFSSEAGHISDAVNKLAMGYPEIAFKLISNGRIVLNTSGNGEMIDCIANIYGFELARELLPVNHTSGNNTINGFIGKPSVSRSSRNYQTIYINGRFVRNRAISESVERAFHGMVMTGRHPVFIVHLNIDLEEVDVNVHPAKTEVRLAKERVIRDMVFDAVIQALSGNRLIPANVEKVREIPIPIQEELKIPYKKPVPVITLNETAENYIITEEPVISHERENQFPELRPIGQINSTYIVAQGSDGMYLIDQHAAHERVLYEKYMEKPEEFISSEQLLFPTQLELTHFEEQVLNDSIIKMVELGFVVEFFGGDSYLLRAIPAGLSKDGGKEIFLDLLEFFSQNRQTISDRELREKFIITMSCKNAIKAHHKLSSPEMESLLAQLSEAKNPYTCPHGRPTLLHFSGYELEKKFKRVL